MSMLKNHPLKTLNTFGVEVQTALYLKVRSEKELFQALAMEQDPVYILGGGSNILFTENYGGLIIHNCIKGIRVIHETKRDVLVEAGAGENWHTFVRSCLDKGWGGLENLSLIPGTVGAAPIQNIGAYGVEQENIFDSLRAIYRPGQTIHTFSKKDCQFGYRNSFFKNKGRHKYGITAVRYLLTKSEHKLSTSYGAIRKELENSDIKDPTIKDISNAVITIRKSKLPDPAQLGNAGSFFKNPLIDQSSFENLQSRFPDIPAYPGNDGLVKVPAGWLIQQCGWRGYRDEDAGVSPDHALVLVNYGRASGLQIKKLAEAIQKSVLDTFGITIEPEVNIL